MSNGFDEINQLEQLLVSEVVRLRVGRCALGGVRLIGPLATYAQCAASWIAYNQRLVARNAALLQHRKALASKRVEGMADLHPSQMAVSGLCSLR